MTPTEFVLRMRELKEWSGLTYRQLAVRAEESGDVLPSSTLASTLGRRSLPRKEVVAAFVRACGGDSASVAVWIGVHGEIATGAVSAGASRQERAEAAGALSGPGSWPGSEPYGSESRGTGAEPGAGSAESGFHPGGRPRSGDDDAVRGGGGAHDDGAVRSDDGAQGPARGDDAGIDLLVGGAERAPRRGASPWGRLGRLLPAATPGRLGAAVAALVVIAAAVIYGVTTMLTGDGSGGAAEDGPKAGTYKIRSAATSFCLAEKDGDETGVVHQLDCAGSIPTYEVQPAEGGGYWIHSLHPAMGVGCLGVLGGSMATGASLQDDYCGRRGQAEKVHIQKAPETAGGYRIRPAHTGECATVPGATKREGVLVVQMPCSDGDPGQVFRFDPVPVPTNIPSIRSN